MTETALVVHGHFYQPPRENPWTELVAAEPSAAPAHDWNERITGECYRPNGWARIVDDDGKVVAIVDNYAHLSFNIGPTLMSWLADHAPEVAARVVEGDQQGGGAIAQAYNHVILPLANERDVRTQIRWGLADFRHRFGRQAEGMWLPETAVNDTVLRILAEEGVRFTILAPHQAAEPVDTTRTYRWADGGHGVDLIFYDGPISHDLAFGLSTITAEGLIERVKQAAPEGGLVAVATDGETFGHHHTFAERTLAYALPVAAPNAGVTVTSAAEHLRAHPPTEHTGVVESAWSCAHGVDRWKDDCGCSTGGPAGANQRWRAPLRAALDILRDAGIEVFERRGGAVFRDPWQARDSYIDVVLGARTVDDFAAEHLQPDADLVEALTLLEQQRHALLMYTSCAWFFWDLAGLETVQCLRYAARAIDLLAELGEDPPLDAFLDVLAEAHSNQPGEGDGRKVWRRHVEPARVDPARAAAHHAMVSLLQPGGDRHTIAIWDIEEDDSRRARRGSLTAAAGVITLRHRRTGRTTRHAYAAVALSGVDAVGAVRPTPSRDHDGVDVLINAVESGAGITEVFRLLAERFGPDEFGLERALPDAAGEIVADVAAGLEARFATAYEFLYQDHEPELLALVRAGLPLPAPIRLAAELTMSRRLEQEIVAQAGSWEPAAYDAARAVVREAQEHGLTLNAPRARAVLEETVEAAAIRAVKGERDALDAVLALRDLARSLDVWVDLGRAQEVVYDAVTGAGRDDLRPLADAVGLAADRLGNPG